ncbi:alpha-xenorhabdolysin family binary toxin subunit A [Pseudomonas fluorescens]|jgi:hypothetical protein|uniref:alpha-xenorhabdolysin family binary toxin subunit A n=1 Tax=Pseudomonas fluorescens TaxID=294 RepID=UPI0019139B79|nr:alpha-xenorhabdolysin family binary toxin subunit A [Pseudomonas fluorescens]
MSSVKLWADALEGVDYQKVTEFAQNAPKVLAETSKEKTDVATGDITRGDGLILTKKQIIDLHRYEVASLALPVTLKDVIDYLAFGAGQDGGSGLRAADFLDTFRIIREHAQRWAPLRTEIMLASSKLKLFGSNILLYGDEVESLYLELKAGALLDEKNVNTEADLQKLKLDMGDQFPGLELEENTIRDTKYSLKRILDNVHANLTNVQSIKTNLDKFGATLREVVIPAIKLKASLINSNSYPAQVKDLEKVIAQRMTEIAEKNTEYKALVEKALQSAGRLNLFGLGLAIYFGVEAENVRAARRKLNEQQDKDIETLRNMNQTLGSLRRVEHDMQNMTVVAVDADLATKNLIHVWNVLELYVNQSNSVVSEIHDAMSLRRFKLAFKGVVSPWEQIRNDADLLIQVFKDAEREYNQPQGMAV